MSLWEIVLISVGLSLDVFAYCLYKGAMLSELKKGNITKLCVIFTGFQMAALVLGNAITLIPVIHQSYKSANRIWMILAALILFGLGAYMILKSFTRRHNKIREQKEDIFNYRAIIVWACVTSIDALLAGIGFGFLGLRLIGTTIIVGIVTVATVLGGIICGYRLGCGPMNKFVTIGGCIVIIGGIDILMHYII